MGDLRLPSPALLVVASFSRHDTALAWAHDRLQQLFGAIALAPAPISFHHTKYYEPSMGPNLQKQLLAFEQLVSREQLTAIKLQTNELERELAEKGNYAEPRPVNLDPGLLTLGKFELATTKDQAHRIYLKDGIFAEVTLHYQAGQYEPWPWTYADYREPEVRAVLKGFRDYFRKRLAGNDSQT
jgi:hypothetical protein